MENIGASGVGQVGAKIKPGDPIAVVMKKPSPSQYSSKLRKFRRGRPDKYRDKAWVGDKDYGGTVTDVVRSGKTITVYVKTEEPAQQGDKLVGRHGNKGIITKSIANNNKLIQNSNWKPKKYSINKFVRYLNSY